MKLLEVEYGNLVEYGSVVESGNFIGFLLKEFSFVPVHNFTPPHCALETVS